MYFHYFIIISPWERAGPIIWRNLNPLHPKMLCAKFGWNWPSGSREEDENVKSLWQQRRRTTDKFWSEKLTWAFGSGELKNLSQSHPTRWGTINLDSLLRQTWEVEHKFSGVSRRFFHMNSSIINNEPLIIKFTSSINCFKHINGILHSSLSSFNHPYHVET